MHLSHSGDRSSEAILNSIDLERLAAIIVLIYAVRAKANPALSSHGAFEGLEESASEKKNSSSRKTPKFWQRNQSKTDDYLKSMAGVLFKF